jgi:hypothetical protein
VTGVCSWAARHATMLTRFDGSVKEAGVGDVFGGRDGSSREKRTKFAVYQRQRTTYYSDAQTGASGLRSSSARLAFGYQVGDIVGTVDKPSGGAVVVGAQLRRCPKLEAFCTLGGFLNLRTCHRRVFLLSAI